MELDSCIRNLPVTLANFHSATVYSVPLTSFRTEPIYEEDYLDCGGSGIYLDRSDDCSFKTYILKNDCLDGSPFYPKACTLPVRLSKSSRYRKAKTFNFAPNYSNCMVYDDSIDCLIIADPTLGCVSLEKLDHDTIGQPHRTRLNELSFGDPILFDSNDGQLTEITRSFSIEDKRVFLIRQPKAISIVEIDEICDDKLTLNKSCKLDIKLESQATNQDTNLDELYWNLSHNKLLQEHIAIGIDENNVLKLVDYDLTADKPCWTLNQGLPSTELSWHRPINLFWTLNHPKLLLYCEKDNVVMLDARGKSLPRNLIKRKSLKFCREWERFRGVCPSTLNSHQYFIVMDHKLVTIDSRYPQENLLQWNHMLKSDTNNQLRFLNCSTIPANKSSHDAVITLANKDQIALVTINSFDANIIQPHSLHHPMHLSQPVDCWHYSSNVSEPVRDRLETIQLIGCAVCPGSNSYSVCQMTSAGDIFSQEFYDKSLIEIDKMVSWKRHCSPEDIELDKESINMLDSMLEDIEAKIKKSPISKKSIKSARIKTFITKEDLIDTEPLPSSINSSLSDSLDSENSENRRNGGDHLKKKSVLQQPETSNQFECDPINQFKNLLTEDSVLHENMYTLNLLEKWKTNTN